MKRGWGVRVRRVESEILDSLPADDPAGLRSRRDLRMINALMGNFRWIEQCLESRPKSAPVWELGAGEGCLLGRLAQHGHEGTGVDLAPRPSDLPEAAGWLQGDVFSELGDVGALGGAVVASLFLHHFEEESLGRLGKLLSGCEFLAFAEPLRSSLALAEGYALFPLVNAVTRHDMMVSIRAGFRRGELPNLLGLDDSWEVKEETTLLGAYRMQASKR
jgi:hypothetical protein